MQALREDQLARDFVLFGAILIIGLYNAFLFAMRPENRSSLYLGLFSLLLATRQLMRWLGIGLAGLTLVLWVVWFYSESIVTRIVRDQLAGSGFSLVAFELSRPKLSGMSISLMSLKSVGVSVEISNLTVMPLLEAEFSITAEQIKIQLLSIETIRSGSNGNTLKSIWDQVQNIVPILPRSGWVKNLVICQQQNCEVMNAGWRRDEALLLNIAIPDLGLRGSLSASDAWRVDWSLRSELGLALGHWLIKHEDKQFVLSGNGTVKPSIGLDTLEVEGLSGNADSLLFKVGLEVSEQVTLDKAIEAVIVDAEITTVAQWSLATPEGQAYATGPHHIELVYAAQAVNVTIDTLPLIELRHTALDRVELEVQSATTCHLDVDSDAVELKDVRCIFGLAVLRISTGELQAQTDISALTVFQNNQHFGISGSLVSHSSLAGKSVLRAGADFSLLDDLLEFELITPAELFGNSIGMKASYNLTTSAGQFDGSISGVIADLAVPLAAYGETNAASLSRQIKGRFSLSSKGHWSLPTAERSEVLLSHQTRVELSKLDFQYQKITIQNGQFTASLSGWPVVMADVRVAAEKEIFNGQAKFSLVDELFKLEVGPLPTAKLWGSAIEVSVRHHLASGLGQFDVGLHGSVSHFLEPVRLLADPDVVKILEATNGSFNLTSKGQWQLPAAEEVGIQLTHKTAVELNKLAVEYDGYVLDEGDLSAVLDGWPALSGSVIVDVNQIGAGVDITKLAMGFRVYVDSEQQIATLMGDRLTMNLLGGQITSDQYGYDLNTGNGAALLTMSQVQLPELLALQRQDFSCSGILNGSVPVQMTAGILSVSGASIKAQSPGGYLRYQPNAAVRLLGNQNQGLSVVLDAMDNFQYHTLAAAVDYSPEGIMTARTSIKGANPQYQNGREVFLNLNLEENILKLLESLRLGSEMAEKIGEKATKGN
jgi:hypothetical protein